MKYNTKTEQNLQAAFAGEAMANRRYLYFGQIARKLGNEEVATLFERTAEEETGHAFAHLQLMYPEAELTVERLLEIAYEGEMYETERMYPDFERDAREEGDDAAVAEFVEQAAESREHAERFLTVLKGAEKRFKSFARVEAAHAKRYGDALREVQAARQSS
jgi:rubrerythrin